MFTKVREWLRLTNVYPVGDRSTLTNFIYKFKFKKWAKFNFFWFIVVGVCGRNTTKSFPKWRVSFNTHIKILAPNFQSPSLHL